MVRCSGCCVDLLFWRPLQGYEGAAQRGSECGPHGGHPHVGLRAPDGLCHRLDGRGGWTCSVQVPNPLSCSITNVCNRYNIATVIQTVIQRSVWTSMTLTLMTQSEITIMATKEISGARSVVTFDKFQGVCYH